MQYMYLVFVSLFMVPLSASAHAKWFVDSTTIINDYHGVVPFFGIASTEVVIWAFLTLIIVLVASVLDVFVPEPKKLLAFGYKHEYVINRIVAGIVGIFLIAIGTFWGVILAPTLLIIGPWMYTLFVFQTAIGLMLFFNFYPRIASVGLMALCVTTGYLAGFESLLENVLVFAFAIYIYLNNTTVSHDSWHLKMHATEIVRIGAAVELLVLAFTEKLFYPELTIKFVEIYQWNFMQPLFPWFSDALLTLSTGFAQAIFGILFFMGYLTRTTTIAIAGFFVTSFVVMYAQTGMIEVEDLPVYAAAIVFLFFGHGKTKFFHFLWPNSALHKPIVRKHTRGRHVR